MISGGPQGARQRVKGLLPVIAVFAVIGGIYALDPSKGADVSVVTLDYLQEMAIIMPAVVLLMGLFQVWIPKSYVERFLGTRAGAWGFVIALLFGSAPTGPLYVAFPLAAALRFALTAFLAVAMGLAIELLVPAAQPALETTDGDSPLREDAQTTGRSTHA